MRKNCNVTSHQKLKITALAVLSLGLVVLSSPVSYQHVKFIRGEHSRPSIRSSTFRPSRSFGFSSHELYSSTPEDIWQQVLDPSGPSGEALSFETHNGHITPDFSNGLDYQDPFLLTGPAAKRAASVLYRKSLFFGDINHVKSLLYLQEQRKRSGLAGNNLGSLRPYLPWYRFKKNFNFFK